MKATLYLLSLMLTVSLWGQPPCDILRYISRPDCCPPTNCDCGDWEVRYMYIILAPPEYPGLDCAVDVRYRVRRCYGPPPECAGCQVEIDWIWPVCAPCNDRRGILDAVRTEIIEYGLRNSDCQPFGGNPANIYRFQHPSCWRETNVPPPDLPPIPTGWQLPEVWLIPCTTDQYCCVSYDANAEPQCYWIEPQKEPRCVYPDPGWDCNINMCCPP